MTAKSVAWMTISRSTAILAVPIFSYKIPNQKSLSEKKRSDLVVSGTTVNVAHARNPIEIGKILRFTGKRTGAIRDPSRISRTSRCASKTGPTKNLSKSVVNQGQITKGVTIRIKTSTSP